VTAPRIAALGFTLVACNLVVPSYGLGGDGGLDAPISGSGRGSSCWGTPGCITAIAAGYKHTCAIADQRTLYCWGASAGTDSAAMTPQPIATGVTSITLSSDVRSPGTLGVSCFTTISGLYCWGDDDFDQLQQHATTDTPVPIDSTLYAQVSAGADHVCATKPDSTAVCWGADDLFQLGGDSAGTTCGGTTCANSPLLVMSNTGIPIASGLSHTCVVMGNNSVDCWGRDTNGQLGNGKEGSGSDDELVTALAGSNDVTQIAAGSLHTCAIAAMGSWACWGYGGDGALGTGSNADVKTAVLADNHQFSAIAAGAQDTCAIDTAGSLDCWGENQHGILGSAGMGAAITTPAPFGSLNEVQLVSVGYSHACALLLDGTLECWGDNADGELGDGKQHQQCGTSSADCSPTPVVVSAPQ
jgi:alpha-tubulin suppressor-like RCC1 family protein